MQHRFVSFSLFIALCLLPFKMLPFLSLSTQPVSVVSFILAGELNYSLTWIQANVVLFNIHHLFEFDSFFLFFFAKGKGWMRWGCISTKRAIHIDGHTALSINKTPLLFAWFREQHTINIDLAFFFVYIATGAQYTVSTWI